MTRDSENWHQKIKLKRELFPLTPLARQPIKFEPFRLLVELAQARRISIHDGKLGTDLLSEVEHSVRAALADDAFLYGHLTESLFQQCS